MDEHLGKGANGCKPAVIDKPAFNFLASFLQGTVELVNQWQGSTRGLVVPGNGPDLFKKAVSREVTKRLFQRAFCRLLVEFVGDALLFEDQEARFD